MDKQFLSLAEGAKIVPTCNGKKCSTQTLWRWCSHGVDGHRLKHYRFGKRIAVTLEDLVEFGRILAEAHPVPNINPPVSKPSVKSVSDKQREKQIEHAEARLRARGVLD